MLGANAYRKQGNTPSSILRLDCRWVELEEAASCTAFPVFHEVLIAVSMFKTCLCSATVCSHLQPFVAKVILGREHPLRSICCWALIYWWSHYLEAWIRTACKCSDWCSANRAMGESILYCVHQTLWRSRCVLSGAFGQNRWENEGSHLQAARSKNSEIKNIKVIAF